MLDELDRDLLLLLNQKPDGLTVYYIQQELWKSRLSNGVIKNRLKNLVKSGFLIESTYINSRKREATLYKINPENVRWRDGILSLIHNDCLLQFFSSSASKKTIEKIFT